MAAPRKLWARITLDIVFPLALSAFTYVLGYGAGYERGAVAMKTAIFGVLDKITSTAAVGSAPIHKPYGPAPTASDRTGIASGKAE